MQYAIGQCRACHSAHFVAPRGNMKINGDVGECNQEVNKTYPNGDRKKEECHGIIEFLGYVEPVTTAGGHEVITSPLFDQFYRNLSTLQERMYHPMRTRRERVWRWLLGAQEAQPPKVQPGTAQPLGYTELVGRLEERNNRIVELLDIIASDGVGFVHTKDGVRTDPPGLRSGDDS